MRATIRQYFGRNFVFTSVSLSLFRVLCPSFIFSCTTIATAVHVKMKLGDNALNN